MVDVVAEAIVNDAAVNSLAEVAVSADWLAHTVPPAFVPVWVGLSMVKFGRLTQFWCTSMSDSTLVMAFLAQS
jgi:hypothetical protein